MARKRVAMGNCLSVMSLGYTKNQWSIEIKTKDFFKDLLENAKKKYAIAKVEVEEFAKNGADRKKAPAWDFMSRCHCLIKRLESNKSRNEIVKEIIQEITDNAFIDEKLDCNLNLLGFENGVLDFSHGKPTFRKAKADEYVSMSCGYDFKWLSEKECEEWLRFFVRYTNPKKKWSMI